MHYNYGNILENNLYDHRQFEEHDVRDVMSKCRKYKRYHVTAHMRDGSVMDGIIEDMDHDGVTMLVPEDVDGDDDDRQFGGFNGFDGYGGYGGYGRRRFRRFRRRRFPFFVFAFPFFTPYPYYYPYY